MLREAESVSVEEEVSGLFTPAPAMAAAGVASGAVVLSTPAQRYGEGKGFNWSGAVLTVLLHVVLITGFFMIKDHIVKKRQERLTVMNLMQAAPPPPPPSDPQPPTPQQATVVTPRPIVQTLLPSPVEIQTTPDPVPAILPPAPAVPNPAPAAAPPSPPSILQADNLSDQAIYTKPPSRPMESRRLKEEGTVALIVLLGVDGRVASVSVKRTSGFHRLDDAALQAVRKWRWQPQVRNGQPVMVQGVVEISFMQA
ncbi:energy transducer TonB [Sphingobium sufflavum]|uniref:energy transducer TonB n=1 Tax=Sphingobium sufflavum TaxID=1129547 RepID=UPI001F42D2E7|nr:energy transducer TonB [Sphingobium sufflavum]MCE7798633.1 energy transducer TonB [Sphingobium sufflavum]